MNDNVNTSPETQVEEQAQESQTEIKMYSEQEVQSMIDRRVQQAMLTAERKTNAKIKEAEKLAKMNESEKYEYQLEQREKAIAEKEKALALAENKAEAGKILADKGLSLSLVDFVVAEDAETMATNIKILETAFNMSVKAEVEKRLASKAPRQNLPLDKPITQAEFANMSYNDMVALKQQNPELFRQLSQ